MVAICRRCKHRATLYPANLIPAFGKDCSAIELRPKLRCSECRAKTVNLHESDWSGGLTTLFHRFGLLCFGWDAQLERVLAQLLDAGIDGVYSDHVDRMVDSLAAFGR